MNKKRCIETGEWIRAKGQVTKSDLAAFLVQNDYCEPPYVRFAIKKLIDMEQCFEQMNGMFVSMGGRRKYSYQAIQERLEDILSTLPFPVCVCPVSGFELNRFTTLQSFSPRTIVYAPRIVHDELAALLSKQGYLPLVLRKGMRTYFNDKTVFLSGLHWRTPLDRRGKKLSSQKECALLCHPTMEKLLIDALSGDFGGDEHLQEQAIVNALNSYTCNISTLFRYAKDRNKEEKLMNLFEKCGLKEKYYDRPQKLFKRMD